MTDGRTDEEEEDCGPSGICAFIGQGWTSLEIYIFCYGTAKKCFELSKVLTELLKNRKRKQKEYNINDQRCINERWTRADNASSNPKQIPFFIFRIIQTIFSVLGSAESKNVYKDNTVLLYIFSLCISPADIIIILLLSKVASQIYSIL